MENIERHLYVILYKDKNSGVVHCKRCRVIDDFHGQCPFDTRRCFRYADDFISFDNNDHIIICTQKGECKGKEYNCNRACTDCAIYRYLHKIRR